MKLRHYIYSAMAALLMFSATACTPDKDDLGAVDFTEDQIGFGDGFSVEIDTTSNYVTFKSLLSSKYKVYWEYGSMPDSTSVAGSSTESAYKVGLAFPKEYYVRMGVMTRGGIVFSKRYHFDITKMNPALISDDLWTMLTGGVGNSKTWVLDLDPNNPPTYALKFGGPKWFYTSGQSWDSFHNKDGQNYIDADQWDATTATDPTYSSEWYWSADYAGNSWMCGLSDYGEMTFDLIGAANVNVNGTKGSYYLDAESHTISFTGLLPLNTGCEDAIQKNCANGVYKIIYLTENAMQILFDGDAVETPFTMNYISKSYRDNYVAPVSTVVPMKNDYVCNVCGTVQKQLKSEPTSCTNEDCKSKLEESDKNYKEFSYSVFHSWKDYIHPFNGKVTTYTFDSDKPVVWYKLDGTQITDHNSVSPNSNIADASIKFDSSTNTVTIVDVDGNTTTATYTLDENGKYVFTTLPSFSVTKDNSVYFGNRYNQLQIIDYDVDDQTGDLTNLYLGSVQYDAQGNAVEYATYNLVKETGTAKVESFGVTLGYADTGWAFITYDPVYVTGEGTYTFSIKPDGTCNTQDPYLYYIDVKKLLKKYPYADITINSIKVDGNEILGTVIGENTFDDTFISRGVGDKDDDGNAFDGRRYLLNPWNEASATFTSLFKFSTSIDVTVFIEYHKDDPTQTVRLPK